MDLLPESRMVCMSSSFNTLSRSRTTSFRSIETTSPVSSSTKSSIQVRNTLAASRRSMTFLSAFCVASTSSDNPNKSSMSLSVPYPIDLSKVVIGNFFFLSMYAYMTLFTSVANSIHEPLKGIILAE